MSTVKKAATKSDAAVDAAAILDVVDAEVVTAKPATTETLPRPVPQELVEQLDEIQKLYDSVTKQIEDFKSGQAYLPGDIPVTLRGLGGPGFEMGQRRLNWIDERHLDSRFAFRWCNKKPDIMGHHIGRGRWPEKWDAFVEMVVARGGKQAAEMYKLRFQKSPDGYVSMGDLILMRTTREQDEALKAAVRRRTNNLEGTAKSNLYDACNKLGTEPLEGEMNGPKLQRIVAMLEKELGPNVRRVFLGQ